jgi:hypothetical protein
MTSKIKVDTITTESGSTLTVGGCGKTVALASGASQTGFGRTGTVDWQTTTKTGDFTAVNGQGYFVDTTSGAVTMTMPSGSAGAIVSIQDYNKTFDDNNFTIAPASGEKINGGAADGVLIIATEGQGLTFVYVDGTVGWKTVHENEFISGGSNFIAATGGTVTCSGNCKIHTFTGPGTFCVSAVAACAASNVVSYLIVGGGGGGAAGGSNEGGGGGGAGGFREVKSPVTPFTASPLDGYPSAPNRVTVTAQAYPIVVGAGGASNTSGGSGVASEKGNPGSNSSFGGQTGTGGGGGGAAGGPGCAPSTKGESGGSGGGSGAYYSCAASSGNSPPTTPSQGNNGGVSLSPGAPGYAGGGGGGAGAVGTNAQSGTSPPSAGNGGSGVGTEINPAVGTPGPSGPLKYFAGGGGGGKHPGGYGDSTGGDGGGAPGSVVGGPSRNATDNTGGGGGGVGATNSSGSGGSGIVIIRYKFQ